MRFSSLKSSDVEEVYEGKGDDDAASFSDEAPLTADEVTVVTGVLGWGDIHCAPYYLKNCSIQV